MQISENININSSNTNITHDVTDTNSESSKSTNEVDYANEISCDNESLNDENIPDCYK